MNNKLKLIILPAAAVFALDQLTKYLVVVRVKPLHSTVIIPGLFNLVHIHNRGIAFGIMNQHGHPLWFFFITATSLVIGAALVFWYIKSKDNSMLHGLGTSLIIGGTAGNVTDRFRLGSVIDFIDLYVGKFHWPAFNIADASITIGTCLIALYLLMAQRSGHAS